MTRLALLAFLLTDVSTAAGGSEPDSGEQVLLSVELHLATEVEASALEAALAEVERIFEPGGIRFEWHCPLCSSPPSSTPLLEIVVGAEPPNKVVTGCRRNRHDHRLGLTLLRRRQITLWTAQVTRAVSGDWDRVEVAPVDARTFGRALGRVCSHELGHLLLRLSGHRDRGLMRSSFSHRSLTSRRGQSFRLHSEDLNEIRKAIASLKYPALHATRPF